jgi:hypothetical protein
VPWLIVLVATLWLTGCGRSGDQSGRAREPSGESPGADDPSRATEPGDEGDESQMDAESVAPRDPLGGTDAAVDDAIHDASDEDHSLGQLPDGDLAASPEGGAEAFDAGPFCPLGDAGLPPIPDACIGTSCVQAACHNGVKDEYETDVDCGGSCSPCRAGQRCSVASDCESQGCATWPCSGSGVTTLLSCFKRCASTPPAAVQVTSLPIDSIARDPRNGTIYASLGAYQSMAGAVAAFAPGALDPSFVVGLPAPAGALAVTDDGSTLYAGVRGATPGVVRIDLATRTAGTPFSLGTSTRTSSAIYASALATVPGRPDLIGVVGNEVNSSSNLVGVHLYQNGVPLFDPTNSRWQINSDSKYALLNVTAAVFTSERRLYTLNGASSSFDFATVDVGPSGMSIASVRNDIIPDFDVRPTLAGEKLFMSGTVVAAAEPRVLGSVDGAGAMAVSRDGRRIYRAPSGADSINCFEADTFTHSGVIALGMPAGASAISKVQMLELWGEEGLALVDNGATKRLVLAPTALRGVPGCSPSGDFGQPPVLPISPDAKDDWVQTYYLSVAEMAYAPRSKTLYASVRQGDDRLANRVVGIRTDGSGITFAPWVGSDPGALAISDDESRAWIAPTRSAVLTSVDLHTGLTLSSYPLARSSTGQAPKVSDLAVLPASPDSVVVTASSGSRWEPVNIFDRGVPRFVIDSNVATTDPSRGGRVVVDSSTVYVTGSDVLAALRVGALGFSTVWTLPRATYPLTLAQGKLFDGSPLLVSAAQHRLLGGFPNPPPALTSTLSPNALHAYRARYASGSPPGKRRINIECFDTRAFAQSGGFSFDVPDPQRRTGSQQIEVSALGDSGLTLRMDQALVLAPQILNCVPGCAPDAPVPSLPAPAVPDAQDVAANVLAYSKLQVADLERDRQGGKLFASIMDTDTRQSNRVLVFDGASGALRSSVHVGSNPGPLATSSDGSKLYVGLRRSAQVVTLDVASGAVSPLVTLEPITALSTGLHYADIVDIEAAPGNSDALAIATEELDTGAPLGAWLYRGGTRTPLFNVIPLRVDAMKFVDDHTLWSAQGSLTKISVAADGTFSQQGAPALADFPKELTMLSGGRFVTDTGFVVDTQTGMQLGQLPVAGANTASSDGSRILVVSNATGSSATGRFTLTCYDPATLQVIGSTMLPVPSGFDAGYNAPIELERFGPSGVAMRTDTACLLLYPKALNSLPGC